MKINYPETMDADIKDLVEKLLVREPEKRLGAGAKGSENDFAALKKHKLFKSIKWEKLKDTKPPIAELMSNLKKDEAEKKEGEKEEENDDKKEKEIKIVLSGLVQKKNKWMFYQERQLVLNNKPQLVYFDPVTNKLRVSGEYELFFAKKCFEVIY
jgi:serine/threonine protein kinase